MDKFKCKPCTWNNIAYESQAHMARALWLTPAAIAYRMRMGYTSDNDMPGGGGQHRPCEWNGVQYPSINAAAQANGVKPNTMAYRIRRGYTCDEDLR